MFHNESESEANPTRPLI